jgi:hypothetical protein
MPSGDPLKERVFVGTPSGTASGWGLAGDGLAKDDASPT